MNSPKYPWEKVLIAAVLLFTVAPVMWFTEARGIFGGHPLVEKFGLFALLIGAAIGTILVAVHYWNETKEIAALQQPHRSRDT